MKAGMSREEQTTATQRWLRVVECQETMKMQLLYHFRTLLRSLKQKSVKEIQQKNIRPFFNK